MFARHLMASTFLSTGPAYRKSDIGFYGQYVRWELDRTEGVLYRTPAASGGPSVNAFGRHDAAGRITVSQTRAGVIRNLVFNADNVGLIEPPVASYPIQQTSNALPLGLTATSQVYSNNPASSAPSDAYAFTEFNFVLGQTFKPLTIPRVNLPNGIGAFANGSDVYLLSGTYLGYRLKTSNAWAATIPASGGRAARTSIPRQVYEEQGLSTLLRLRGAAAPEPIAFTAWRRPMTSDTRVRAVTFLPTGAAHTSSTRRGKVYTASRVIVHEIEITPASGTGVANGQPVSYHRIVEHYSDYDGHVVIDGTATNYIVTSSGTVDKTTDVSQYLAADGTPTGEYITTSSGAWSYAPTSVIRRGARPYTVTASNILTSPLDASGNFSTAANSPFNVLDLAGTFVKTGVNPPVSTGFVRIMNADALVTTMLQYKAKGWVSYDLGGSWVPLQFWGPRGSVDPNYTDVNRYPNTNELATLDYHYYV